ncbi:lipopolysaccharide transport periplasmic protein LptA [Parasulfuritortus cantonensis]|uniref:Lipopolysaccharide export system protein LptA n=1 Tax=Parasulfuritortus cantonensis TaxID=2528202 RepID=A0A4R1BE49_9PROT|nr:lipopolysaccharide transport periplasmic protein LptA [Parasulfuritortus cantonensis]TCJ15415.1 lipopolysaccharide transport periplasmic protein LptA [Parasulfuritortus cantonensis]
MKLGISPLLLLAVAGLAAFGARAEQADRTRPVQIEADSVRLDDLNKTAVYEGNVMFTQGTLTITADRVDVRQDDKGLASGEATGQPVFMRQKMEGRDEYMEAHGKRALYDARTGIVKLIGNAYINQAGDELRGGVIVYDMRTERYQAQGAADDSSKGRIRAIIRPRTTQETGAAKP